METDDKITGSDVRTEETDRVKKEYRPDKHKIDLKKLVIYSEIMSPKYKE